MNCFQYSDITAETGLVKLTKVEDISYFGGQSVIQTTTYAYDRLDNQYEITSLQQTRSDGSVLKKNFKYPKDINATIYKSMVEKNMLSPVIVTTTYINNEFLQETQTAYSSWANSFIAPSDVIEQQGTGPKETRLLIIIMIQKEMYYMYLKITLRRLYICGDIIISISWEK